MRRINIFKCKQIQSNPVVLSSLGTLGNVEHGNQYQIKLMYEHHLQRTAFNMTYGAFGGVKGNLLLIMSVLLQVPELEHSRSLNNLI